MPSGRERRNQLRRRGFATKKAAAQAGLLVELLADIQHGTFVRPTKTTCADYLRSWVDGLPASGRRPSTVDSYRRNIEPNVIPAVGGVELQGLTPVDLDLLYAALLDRRLSMRSVRYVHTIVGKALSDAERKGLVQRNVTRLATPPGCLSGTGARDAGVDTR